MKKLTKNICFLIASLALLLLSMFIIKPAITASAANNVQLIISSSLTEIKSNNTSQDFTITVTVKNNSGIKMQTSQATLNFDPNYFEYVSWVGSTSADINSYLGQAKGMSDLSNGKVVLVGEDKNGADIAHTQWVLGAFKLKIKAGASLAGVASSSITLNADETELMNAEFEAFQYDAVGGNLAIRFAEPSNACDMTAVKVNNINATASGTTYTVEVPYTYSKFTSVSPTLSAGATAAYSLANNANIDVGENTITVTVTAEDKTTTKTYTLIIKRKAAETACTLSGLTFKKGSETLVSKGAGDLAGAATFAVPEDKTIAYAEKDTLSVEFNKMGTFSTAQVLLDGANKGSASPTNLGTVSGGAHTLTVKITAQSGASTEYKITFNVVEAELNATLSSLSLKIVKPDGEESVNFAESFSPTTTTYSATVPQGTTKVKVYAKVSGEFATIEGVKDYSKEYTVPCSITIKVKPQSGEDTTYTIIVSVAKDTSGLTLSNVKAIGLKKDGNTVITEQSLVIENTSVADYFTVSIPFSYDITHIKIKADEFVSDEYRVEGINYDVDINRAEKTKHLVRFIKNNVVEKTITYDIIYESNVKTLSKLVYGGKEVDLTTGLNYFFVEVAKEDDRVIVEPTPTDPNAKATVISIISDSGTPAAGTREVKLAGGINPILISVKATNGDEGTYVLCIMRPLGTQLLTSLKCGDTDVSVSDNTKVYEVKVGADVNKLKITAGAVDGASVFIDYADVEEIISEGEKMVKLSGESTLVPVKVTATDGTVSMYVLNVTRELPGVDTMPYVVAIVVISVIAVLVIIALTVVIIVNRRKS